MCKVIDATACPCPPFLTDSFTDKIIHGPMSVEVRKMVVAVGGMVLGLECGPRR
jgi:hypothetical protein